MLRWLPFLLLPALQDSEIDELLRRLETAPATARDAAIEAVVAKGDAAEAPVRKKLEGAGEGLKERLNLVLRRMELQRKLRELHPLPKPVHYDVKDKPLIEVVADVEKWLGLPIRREGLPDERVTLKCDGLSPLQALDAFHGATGLTWRLEEDRRYDKEQEIHIHELPKARLFKAEHSKWPSCAPGRYRVSAGSTRLDQTDIGKGPAASGQVSVSIQCPFASQSHDLLHFTVSRIVDNRGRELAQLSDTSRPPFPRIGPAGPSLYRNRSFRFAHPAADAVSISLLGCKARVGFVVERVWLTFDRPETAVGTTLESDGIKVKLKEFQPAYGWMRLVLDQSGSLKSAGLRVESFEYRGTSLVEHVEVEHEDGRITYPSVQGAQGEEGVYRKRMMCFGTPKVKAIRLAVRSFFAYEDIEFELRDIPLPGAK